MNESKHEVLLIASLLHHGRGAMGPIATFLKPAHFRTAEYRAIYRAILDLYTTTVADISTVTVTDRMMKDGSIRATSEANIVGMLIENMELMPARPDQVVATARFVAEDGMRMLAYNIAKSIQSKCEDPTEDVFAIIAESQKKFDEIGLGGAQDKILPVTDGIIDAIAHIESMKMGTAKAWGIPTGFKVLDRYVYGWEKKNLIVMGGRPSHGKTALAMTIAKNQAMAGQKIGVFSMEMSNLELIVRMLSAETGIAYQDIKTGRLSDGEFATILGVGNNLGARISKNLFVADVSSLTLSELRLQTMMAKDKYGIDGIYIDYLQLINMEERGLNRDQQIGKVTRGLKAMAKELDIFVVVLSQLSRALEARPDKRPQLSDLRESGNIEADADVVLFVWRPIMQGVKEIDMYGETMETDKIAVVLIAKQRNGRLGEAVFDFIGERIMFAERVYVPKFDTAPAAVAESQLPLSDRTNPF